MDQKIKLMMKSNDKTRSLALPIPVLPSSLVGILLTKSIDEVDAVESLLADNEYGLKNQEELVSKNNNLKCYINHKKHIIIFNINYNIYT